jgi:hypothetical protein
MTRLRSESCRGWTELEFAVVMAGIKVSLFSLAKGKRNSIQRVSWFPRSAWIPRFFETTWVALTRLFSSGEVSTLVKDLARIPRHISFLTGAKNEPNKGALFGSEINSQGAHWFGPQIKG